MYTFKTNFQEVLLKICNQNTGVDINKDDAQQLIEMSQSAILKICQIDITNFSVKMEGRLKLVDQNNGNIYTIHLEFDSPVNKHKFYVTYYFKYNENHKLYLFNNDLYIYKYLDIPSLPFHKTAPDSIYLNFNDDNQLESYEVNYLNELDYYQADRKDIVTIDYKYTISDKKINLTIVYNDYLEDREDLILKNPYGFCSIKKENISLEDIQKDYFIFQIINRIESKSMGIKEFFDYISKESLSTADSFKQTYFYFIENEENEFLKNKLDIIKMEMI